MSMQPKEPGKVPAETVRVARAAFPKGSLAIRLRDELGMLFADEQFADLFPVRGKPAWSPGRLEAVVFPDVRTVFRLVGHRVGDPVGVVACRAVAAREVVDAFGGWAVGTA